MGVLETETRQAEGRPESVEELLDVGGELAIDVGVHDSSRLEWTAVIPADGVRRYRLVFELDVPTNLAPAHLPWAQLQSLARFERPHDPCDHADPIARLREEALITTSRLTFARDGFVRHVGRLATEGAPEAEHEALVVWFHAGLEAIGRARASLAELADPRLERERGFVDEYLSTQVVSMLTGMARALDGLEHKDAWIERLQPRIVDALIAESEHRQACGYVSIEDTSPEGLAGYVERRAALKKRFQAMLYLRRQSTPVEERIRPWVTALSAATAGVVAFSLQLLFGTGRSGLGDKVGWSLVVLLVVVALAYGTKERLQIAGVQWLSRGLGRWYARRSTRLFTASNALVLTARESFAQQTSDPADEDAAVPTVRLRFVHEARLQPSAAHGQLRLIFRYDLSPLFPRMHDPLKIVGVVDRESHAVQFVGAPRTYRLPVRMELSSEGIERRLTASLVLDKLGLHRIEPTAYRSGASKVYPPTV
jgi:hypothetical protein